MLTTVKTIAITALIALATSQSATAADNQLRLGKVGYAGTGCPANSASVNLTEDGRTVSILFDEFFAEAGVNNRTFDRKKCDISVGVKVPSGFSVSLIDADYRGFVELPNNRARARFTREYFFAGRRGPVFNDTWRGKSDEFYKKDRLGVLAHTWSPCGANVVLRAKTAIAVNTQRNQQAVAGVDSADYTSNTIIHHPGPSGLDLRLKFKPCQ